MPRRKTSTSFGEKSGNPIGRGPAKGAPNAGRPTNSFKHFLRNIRTSAAAQNALKAAAEDPGSRNFGTAWKVITDYDKSKPAAKQDLKHSGTVTVVFEREGRRVTAS